MTEKFESHLDSLRQSPLFQLSLSSKELFHSNFIYWTISNNNYKEHFTHWFSDVLKIGGRANLSNLKRENKNIDLTFDWETNEGNNEKVIIELKVKSQPTLRQLNNYTKKFPKAIKILLIAGDFSESFESDVAEAGWRVLRLYELVPFYNFLSKQSNNYHSKLFKDYSVLIQNLTFIFDYSKLESSTQYSFQNEKVNTFLSELKSLRIHDLYLKSMYRQLAYLGIQKLQNNGINSFVADTSPLKNTVQVEHGMTRSQGLVSFKFIKEDSCYLGIQIQGKQFRYFYEEILSSPAIRQYKDKWFQALEGMEQNILSPSKSQKDELKFGNGFRYRYFLIDDKVEIRQILDIVLKAMQVAREL